MDDSSEKCVRNPAHTCIQPHPYDPYGSSMQPRSTQPVSSSLNASVSEIENTNVVVVTDIVVPSNFCSGVKVTDQSAGVTEVEVTGPSSNSENIAPTFDISADSSVVSHSLEIPASSTIPGINTPCGNDNVAILPAVVAGDEELKPNGPLWVYLDRIAQYEGSTKDLFDLCGPYVC